MGATGLRTSRKFVLRLCLGVTDVALCGEKKRRWRRGKKSGDGNPCDGVGAGRKKEKQRVMRL